MQAFYETAALVAYSELASCRSFLESGIGTGRLAAELLNAHLPPDATYLGPDVSPTMVRREWATTCKVATDFR